MPSLDWVYLCFLWVISFSKFQATCFWPGSGPGRHSLALWSCGALRRSRRYSSRPQPNSTLVASCLDLRRRVLYPASYSICPTGYDTRQRARVTSMFFLALPIAGVIGNPISGLIMSGLNGVQGLEGWQWLFLLEGLPSVLIGIVVLFYLTDRPKDARWLSSEEREAITRSVEQEKRLTPHSHDGLLAVFKDFRTYLFAFAVFSQYCVANPIGYWGPTLLKDAGLTDVRIIGLYGAIPLIIGAIGMYLAARHSDARGERLWHAITTQILTVIALIILPAASHDPLTAVACMAAIAVGH